MCEAIHFDRACAYMCASMDTCIHAHHVCIHVHPHPNIHANACVYACKHMIYTRKVTREREMPHAWHTPPCLRKRPATACACIWKSHSYVDINIPAVAGSYLILLLVDSCMNSWCCCWWWWCSWCMSCCCRPSCLPDPPPAAAGSVCSSVLDIECARVLRDCNGDIASWSWSCPRDALEEFLAGGLLQCV